jgi:hypothetical protein
VVSLDFGIGIETGAGLIVTFSNSTLHYSIFVQCIQSRSLGTILYYYINRNQQAGLNSIVLMRYSQLQLMEPGFCSVHRERGLHCRSY